MPRELHSTVRSSKSRAEYHPASRPVSKAVAHAEACAARGWEIDAAFKAVRISRTAAARPSADGRPAPIGAEHIQELLRYCVDPEA